jgi:hypothetical protein
MSRLPEQRLWDKARDHLVPPLLLRRVENIVDIGDPDFYAIYSGIVTHVECKAVDGIPVRPDTPLLGRDCVTREQRNWHYNWRKFGGRSIFLIAIGSRDIIAIDNAHTERINEMSFAEMLQIAVAVDWVELKDYLCGRR